MRACLADILEGLRVVTTREFWAVFRAYWSPDAVAARIEAWLDEVTL